MAKERIEYIDNLKAIGICAVVLGHCSHSLNILPHQITSFIYLWHMPLFFIVSGFFIKQLSFKSAILKHFQYVHAYIVASIVTLALVTIISILGDRNIFEVIKNLIISILWGSGASRNTELLGELPSIGPVWFLLALFWACSIYSFLCYKINDYYSLFIICVALWLFGTTTINYIRLPFSIQPGLCAILYLYVGDLIRRYSIFEKFRSLDSIAKLSAIFIILYCCLKGSVVMVVGNFGLHLTSVLASILMIIWLGNLVSRRKLMGGGKIGQNTLYILIGNQVVDYLNWNLELSDFILYLQMPPIILLFIEFIFNAVFTCLMAFMVKKAKLI